MSDERLKQVWEASQGALYNAWNLKINRSGVSPGASFAFVGPAYDLKEDLVLKLIQRALCEEQRGCGKCGPCKRISEKSHESLLWIEPDGAPIKIDQVRDIQSFLTLKSWTQKRFVVIEKAQMLGMAAANSLLKTLEEPPEGTFIFLLLESANQMISTIRSRVQLMNVKPISQQILRDILNVPESEAKLSRGLLGLVFKFLEKDQIEVRRRNFDFLIKRLMNEDEQIEADLKEILSERDKARELFEEWLLILRDAVAYQNECTVISEDLLPQLELLSKYKTKDLLTVAGRVHQLLIQSQTPLDLVTQTQALFFGWKSDRRSHA